MYNSDLKNPVFTNGDLEMYMLDVGQGDSFVFLQDDKVLLIDAGPLYKWNKVNRELKKIGVKKIDYAILTHPHRDHAGGLYSVMLNYKIEHLYITDMSTKKIPYTNLFYHCFSIFTKIVDNFSQNQMLQLAKESGELRKFTFAETEVNFLAPISDTYEAINDYSLVAMIKYKDVKILMTGDIQKTVEEELLNSEQDISANIYKAAHHGSNTSNSLELLEKVNPEYVLISSNNGDNNYYGHPVKSFMKYLKENKKYVFRTDISGTIQMLTDGKKIEFKSEPDNYKSGRQLLKEKSK